MIVLKKKLKFARNWKIMKKLAILGIIGTIGIFTSCSHSISDTEPTGPTTDPEDKFPITLNVTSASASRLNDSGFEENDAIGLYVAHRKNTEGNTLLPTGNYVDNMRFVLDNSNQWVPDQPIYWQDQTTHADFYVYYPYSASLTDATAFTLRVAADQSSLENFQSSDFTYGKTLDVTPTQQAVNIMTNHVCSQMIIYLKAGNGFTEEELKAAQISLKINSLKTEGSLNLANGEITLTGEAKDMTPYQGQEDYRLLVLPQSTTNGNLITVNINGQDYFLNKNFTFTGGKIHRFTVTVNKSGNGVNVGVNPWEDDGTDNGGVAM